MTTGRWTEGVPLAPLTSWQIGGPCFALAEPENPEELTAARREAERRGWPVFLLGAGTNLLVADEGYPGLVIRYAGRDRRIEERGDRAIVRAEARTPFAGLARDVSRAGWAGLEWAEGIPGSVAGATVGNAGAYGGEVASRISCVEIVLPGGAVEVWEQARMGYAYRASALKGLDPAGPAVVATSFRLQRDDPVRLTEEMQRLAARRKTKTPVGASCGCVFRNLACGPAGRLIEEAGCKGLRRGGAVVSTLHANYLINEGGARARDLLELIDVIRQRVRESAGVEMELEIQLVGFRSAP
jgi:UDP-N-acetylmuramate dehydrogenase